MTDMMKDTSCILEADDRNEWREYSMNECCNNTYVIVYNNHQLNAVDNLNFV